MPDLRVLIIEDEKRLAETLADILSENNVKSDITYDGQSGIEVAAAGEYDAIILDVMLPKLDGFEAVRKLRESGVSTPVLMLTAKTELSDRVRGLDCGADYYLTKPFESKMLMACLRAIMRRGDTVKSEEMIFSDICVNTALSELTCGNRSVRLSAKELKLISMLIANKNVLLPKESIYIKVWGYDGEADDSIVEVYLSFLRKKLLHVCSGVKITVVRRVGYRLEESSND